MVDCGSEHTSHFQCSNPYLVGSVLKLDLQVKPDLGGKGGGGDHVLEGGLGWTV